MCLRCLFGLGAGVQGSADRSCCADDVGTFDLVLGVVLEHESWYHDDVVVLLDSCGHEECVARERERAMWMYRRRKGRVNCREKC